MIILDINVLINAVVEDARLNLDARIWLERTANTSEVLGLPWVSVLGFVRIATNPRILPHPLSTEDALGVMERMLSEPNFVVTEPTSRHFDVLSGLLRRSGTAGNLTTDAHIAALAIEHGASVASFDRDIARFDVPVIVPSS